MPYICPICHETLIKHPGFYRCEKNHQYDLAKEGYLHLLPVQHKRSKDPGDNKEMMIARREFLNADHYHALRQNVSELLNQFISCSPTNHAHVLDIGCGEGYYTNFFAEQTPQATFHGLDISKVMIRAAAKRYKETRFLVASSQRLPFKDQSLDAIIRIYAPCDPTEITRTLKAQGILITVTPAPYHLYQLKEGIYSNVYLHDVPAESIPQVECIFEQNLRYTMQLNGEDATTLLQMTPFAWRAPESLWQTLKQTEQYACEADFMIRVYRKLNSNI